MPSAGTQLTLTAVGQNIFTAATDGGKCTAFYIFSAAASVDVCEINVPGLHLPGEYFGLVPGKDIIFRLAHLGIASVFARSAAAGGCVISYGVVSKTFAGP